MAAVVVRCDKCGKERSTHNDPRKNPRATIIECKATCFESHVQWTFVREDAPAPAPAQPQSSPAAASPAVAAGAGRGASDGPLSPSDRPPVRQAFAQSPEAAPAASDKSKSKGSDAAPKSKEEKKSGGCTML